MTSLQLLADVSSVSVLSDLEYLKHHNNKSLLLPSRHATPFSAVMPCVGTYHVRWHMLFLILQMWWIWIRSLIQLRKLVIYSDLDCFKKTSVMLLNMKLKSFSYFAGLNWGCDVPEHKMAHEHGEMWISERISYLADKWSSWKSKMLNLLHMEN